MLGERDIFFDTAELAVEAVYRETSTATPRNILVLFTSESSPSQIGETTYQNAVPTALCKSEEVVGASVSSTIKINGTLYGVLSVRRDSMQFTLLELTTD